VAVECLYQAYINDKEDNMFINNHYTRIYFNIIERARKQPATGYTERHHIVPKSLGGTNDVLNIVRLNAREHFICHRLLTRMTRGEARKKMVFAAWRMCSNSRKMKRTTINSRTYLILKEEMVETLRALPRTPEWRAKIGAKHRNKVVTAETKAKLAALRLGKKIKTRSQESYIEMGKKRREKSPWNRRFIVTTAKRETFVIETLFDIEKFGMTLGTAKSLVSHGKPSRRGLHKGWVIQEHSKT
jgi:hypothetical protein